MTQSPKKQGASAKERDSQQDALQKDLELLARLREQIEHLPDIDASKIVRLHERIMRGEYQVDSDSLADKLSDFESEL
jgi:flagellar biosynthesis anti-sigma factor FlgM